MKTKQRGTINIPKWELDVICKFCNSVITLEKAEDMYKKSHPTGNMDGIYMECKSPTYHYICPECGKQNKIASRNIRKDIKSKVKYKDY